MIFENKLQKSDLVVSVGRVGTGERRVMLWCFVQV